MLCKINVRSKTIYYEVRNEQKYIVKFQAGFEAILYKKL